MSVPGTGNRVVSEIDGETITELTRREDVGIK